MVLLSLLLSTAEAKDLRNHVGVGLHKDVGGLSQLSLRFGLPTQSATVNVQMELLGGFELVPGSTKDGAYGGGAKVHFGVVAEDNMNFYLGVGASYLGYATGDAFVQLTPEISAQAFAFGLENLGITGHLGVPISIGLENTTPRLAVQPGIGVHYYF